MLLLISIINFYHQEQAMEAYFHSMNGINNSSEYLGKQVDVLS